MTPSVDIISNHLILKVHSVYEHTTKACFVTSKLYGSFFKLIYTQQRTKLQTPYVK